MKVYNTEFQRLQEEMMEEKRLEAKLAELKRQQEEAVKGGAGGLCGSSQI